MSAAPPDGHPQSAVSQAPEASSRSSARSLLTDSASVTSTSTSTGHHRGRGRGRSRARGRRGSQRNYVRDFQPVEILPQSSTPAIQHSYRDWQWAPSNGQNFQHQPVHPPSPSHQHGPDQAGQWGPSYTHDNLSGSQATPSQQATSRVAEGRASGVDRTQWPRQTARRGRPFNPSLHHSRSAQPSPREDSHSFSHQSSHRPQQGTPGEEACVNGWSAQAQRILSSYDSSEAPSRHRDPGSPGPHAAPSPSSHASAPRPELPGQHAAPSRSSHASAPRPELPGQHAAPSPSSHASALRPAFGQRRVASQSTSPRPSSIDSGALQPPRTQVGGAAQPDGHIFANPSHQTTFLRLPPQPLRSDEHASSAPALLCNAATPSTPASPSLISAVLRVPPHPLRSDEHVSSAPALHSNPAGPATPAQHCQGRNTDGHSASPANGVDDALPTAINQSSIPVRNAACDPLQDADTLKLIDELSASPEGSSGVALETDAGASSAISMTAGGNAQGDAAGQPVAVHQDLSELDRTREAYMAARRGRQLEAQGSKESTARVRSISPGGHAIAKLGDAALMGTMDAEEVAADCLLCCEPLEVIAVGSCNHQSICAKCTIRLRLCYNKRLCPLCKTSNSQVVLARSTYCPVPSWTELDALLKTGSPLMLEQPRWARGVWFYQAEHAQPAFQAALAEGKVRSLEKEMVGFTARSCPICDPQGMRPVTNNKGLQQHMQRSHGRLLCQTCLQERRSFPLELKPMTKEALAQHVAQTHFRCSICSDLILYDEERYLNHMHQRHYKCHLCAMAGRSSSWHRDWHHLNDHFRADHYQCEHELCDGCMAAFNTELELHEHWAEVHPQERPTRRGRPLTPVNQLLLEQPEDEWGSEEDPLSSGSNFSAFLDDQVEQYEAAGISRELATSIVQSEHNLDLLERAERPRRNTSPAEAVQAPGSNQAARDQLSALDRDLVELERLLTVDLIPSASADARALGTPPAANLRQAHALLQSSTARRNSLLQHLQASSPAPSGQAGPQQIRPQGGQLPSPPAPVAISQSASTSPLPRLPNLSQNPWVPSSQIVPDEYAHLLEPLPPVIHSEGPWRRSSQPTPGQGRHQQSLQQLPTAYAHADPRTIQSNAQARANGRPWQRQESTSRPSPAVDAHGPAPAHSAGAHQSAADAPHPVSPILWSSQPHAQSGPTASAPSSAAGSWRRTSPSHQQAHRPNPSQPHSAADGTDRRPPRHPSSAAAPAVRAWGHQRGAIFGEEASRGQRGWNHTAAPISNEPPPGARPLTAQNGPDLRHGFPVETSDGLNMIDDDLGWQELPNRPRPLNPSRGHQGGSRGRSRGGPQGSRASARGPTNSTSSDAFPSLAEASSGTAAVPDPTYLRPALVRQIARCSCGHRTRPVVMEEGHQPSMLPCSQSCEAAARRAQLSSAFGVNPQTYVSWVDRARVPDYSPEQMIWAQDRSQVLKTAEGAMATFIQAGPEQRRTSLGTQSRRDREQLHQLAEEYGLVTQSMGNGAQRSLMLYKPQNPGSGRRPSVPGLLLSEAAGRSTRGQLEEALAAAQAKLHPVHLQDVRPGFDLEHLPYEGIAEVIRSGEQSADLLFETEALRSDFLARVGRGWRRDFTVQQP